MNQNVKMRETVAEIDAIYKEQCDPIKCPFRNNYSLNKMGWLPVGTLACGFSGGRFPVPERNCIVAENRSKRD